MTRSQSEQGFCCALDYTMVAMNPGFFQRTDSDQIVRMPKICPVLFGSLMVAEAILFVSAVQAAAQMVEK